MSPSMTTCRRLHGTRKAHLSPIYRRVGDRDPISVGIAHVRLPRDNNVWAFSRAEMLMMMGIFGNVARLDKLDMTGANE